MLSTSKNYIVQVLVGPVHTIHPWDFLTFQCQNKLLLITVSTVACTCGLCPQCIASIIGGLTIFISDTGMLNEYHKVQDFPVVKIPVIFVSVHINIDKESK